MMKQKFKFSFLMTAVFLSALLLVSCGKKKPQTATLRVASNPTTGFEWTVQQEPELFEIEQTYEADAQDEQVTGSGGTDVFVLTPKAAGTAEVTFLYGRSWEETGDETRLTYTMKIDKKMQIKVEAFTGSIPGDISTVPETPEMEIK